MCVNCAKSFLVPFPYLHVIYLDRSYFPFWSANWHKHPPTHVHPFLGCPRHVLVWGSPGWRESPHVPADIRPSQSSSCCGVLAGLIFSPWSHSTEQEFKCTSETQAACSPDHGPWGRQSPVCVDLDLCPSSSGGRANDSRAYLLGSSLAPWPGVTETKASDCVSSRGGWWSSVSLKFSTEWY